jgi:hypothetical protein
VESLTKLSGRLRKPETHKPEVLVVLGGDGTIRTAVEACAGTGTYFLPLPGGTLNVLPRALYGDSPWQEALKETLANPLTKELSGGRVRRNVFFVAAVVGAPGLWMEAREAICEGDILNALAKAGVAFEAMFGTTIQYFISPRVSGKAEVVAVAALLCRNNCAIQSRRLKPLLSMWRTPPNYSGLRPRQHLDNGVMTKA